MQACLEVSATRGKSLGFCFEAPQSDQSSSPYKMSTSFRYLRAEVELFKHDEMGAPESRGQLFFDVAVVYHGMKLCTLPFDHKAFHSHDC